jgi:hypothetical protein
MPRRAPRTPHAPYQTGTSGRAGVLFGVSTDGAFAGSDGKAMRWYNPCLLANGNPNFLKGRLL